MALEKSPIVYVKPKAFFQDAESIFDAREKIESGSRPTTLLYRVMFITNYVTMHKLIPRLTYTLW